MVKKFINFFLKHNALIIKVVLFTMNNDTFLFFVFSDFLFLFSHVVCFSF